MFHVFQVIPPQMAQRRQILPPHVLCLQVFLEDMDVHLVVVVVVLIIHDVVVQVVLDVSLKLDGGAISLIQ
jgi:hypothetical protein